MPETFISILSSRLYATFGSIGLLTTHRFNGVTFTVCKKTKNKNSVKKHNLRKTLQAWNAGKKKKTYTPNIVLEGSSIWS